MLRFFPYWVSDLNFLLLVVGVFVGLAMFFQVAMFTVAGEYLTLRMRKLAFAAMLKQEMGWFDQPNNNTGALCSRLSADAAAIQGVRQLLVLLPFLFTHYFRFVFFSGHGTSCWRHFTKHLYHCLGSWSWNLSRMEVRLGGSLLRSVTTNQFNFPSKNHSQP